MENKYSLENRNKRQIIAPKQTIFINESGFLSNSSPHPNMELDLK